VLDWVESYRVPAAVRLGVPPPSVSSQPPAPAAFLASDDKRARVLGSVVHLTLDGGYSRLTDAQIAHVAGVSTEAFHKHFANKQECYLAVLDEFVREALDSARPSFESASSWHQAVYAAIIALVEYLVAHEALLRIAFIDVFEVGPAIVGRMTRSVERFTKLLADAGPHPRRGPTVALEAITGALWSIISGYVTARRLSLLPCAVDHLTFTVLAPYLGPKTAIEAIQTCRKPSRAM
jgi:AcrR family transcriptional regulator